MSREKSLFEAVRDLVMVYDENNQQLVPAVAVALNKLRPFLYTAAQIEKHGHATTEAFPSGE